MTDSNAPSMRPYGRHLLICTHGDCADPEEAQRLQQRFNALAPQHGLNKLRNPQRVKCTTTDCLGVCSGGPILTVYPDGIWYHHVDDALLERIVREHLLEGQPVEEAIFHRHYPAGDEPSYAPDVRGDVALPEEQPEDNTTIEAAETVVESSEEKKARRAAARERNIKKGLVIINTGNGKGKTTAALGVMTRAWGRGMNTRVIQFFKHENANFGETRAARKMEIPFGGVGDGFTWTSNDIDETQAKSLHGWENAKEIIASGEHDLVILDEFTYVMHFGWLDANEVVAWLREHKPPMLHLIITGRDAPQELVEFADLVTEMREIKHPYNEQGIRAQAGIEF
ncbi:MAG: hypothetical protein GFH27_549423n20 [Chloroflexi bacterium AL-W]|nr:hypothetical protein [Chloroflexi bacterium AL-N1]NOK71524.1 hypothetical protein [Chloroflexi bacterium AL-N10]NOK78870.1 hypothetical protein [Chloroflexi bacterium AL-N5]NOK86346.1 hypothetical protein [Chloroflexi bacterium AL-W]NOK93315.1 hypothetical protein [Chloroflexi bacterium AL-N15]